jgi:hypothetical protein
VADDDRLPYWFGLGSVFIKVDQNFTVSLPKKGVVRRAAGKGLASDGSFSWKRMMRVTKRATKRSRVAGEGPRRWPGKSRLAARKATRVARREAFLVFHNRPFLRWWVGHYGEAVVMQRSGAGNGKDFFCLGND